MRKYTLSKCYACYSGYPCAKKAGKIPRKLKKKLKRFTEYSQRQMGLFEDVSSCNAGSWYRDYYRKYMHLLPFFRKHRKAISFLREYLDYRFNLTDEYQLGWTWEDDNGLFCYGGVMPFKYVKDPEDKTWAYSELVDFFLEFFNIEGIPEFIRSDKDLLKFIARQTKNPKEKIPGVKYYVEEELEQLD